MTIKITYPLDRAARILAGHADPRTQCTGELGPDEIAALSESERQALARYLGRDRVEGPAQSEDGTAGAAAFVRAIAEEAAIKAEKEAAIKAEYERKYAIALAEAQTRHAIALTAAFASVKAGAKAAVVGADGQLVGLSPGSDYGYKPGESADRIARYGGGPHQIAVPERDAEAVEAGKIVAAEKAKRVAEAEAKRVAKAEKDRSAFAALLETHDLESLPRFRDGYMGRDEQIAVVIDHVLDPYADEIGLGRCPSRYSGRWQTDGTPTELDRGQYAAWKVIEKREHPNGIAAELVAATAWEEADPYDPDADEDGDIVAFEGPCVKLSVKVGSTTYNVVRALR